MIDFYTVVGWLTSTGALIAVASWLTRRLIDQQFSKDLKNYQESVDLRLAEAKSGLERELTQTKAEIDAKLRRDVEEYLGDKSAERQYRLEARKRLYTAVGPLRFHLLVAARDFVDRIGHIGSGRHKWAITWESYFGRSTVFRLIRLLAIVELLERQIAYADFAVEPEIASLLRFKHMAFLCLSGSAIVQDHPNVNWKNQIEHIFFDNLSIISSNCIVTESDGLSRVIRFDEFNALVVENSPPVAIRPVGEIMDGFSIKEKPIFWLRLVALSAISCALINKTGQSAGILVRPFNIKSMIAASADKFVLENAARYINVIEDLMRKVSA